MATRKKKAAIPDDCMPKCATCSFYEALTNDGGKCHRYPPEIMGNEEIGYSAFRPVTITDWCGEFTRQCAT